MEIEGIAGPIPTETLDLVARVARTVPVRSVTAADRALLVVEALGRTTVHDLGRVLGVRTWRAYSLLAELLAAGLVQRVSRAIDPDDRRRGKAALAVTPAGLDAAYAIRRRLVCAGVVDGPIDCDGHARVYGPLEAVLVLGHLCTLQSRVMVTLLGGRASYSDLRAATSGGERVVREAVRELQTRGLVAREILADPIGGAVFGLSLSEWGRAEAERIVAEIDAAIRNASLAAGFTWARAA